MGSPRDVPFKVVGGASDTPGVTVVETEPSVAEFLKDDPRQVWAVRDDGRPVFLPDGAALRLRAEVKARWRCPTPACDVPLTTVSGDRRHHWKHLGASAHSSTGESQNHLQAKAMIAYWAAQQAPYADIVEEQATEKDPATSRYRRADVMVNWPDGGRLAFEVEYKPYAPDEWALKQWDYDEHPDGRVECVWLLGHTKFSLVAERLGLVQVPGNELVRVPLLGRHIIASGRTLLVVNPLKRTIGTIVSRYADEDGLAPAAAVDEARLILDSLDECTLDPRRGMVTPTMRELDAAEERRKKRRADHAARLRAAQDAAAAKRERIEVIKKEQLAVWKSSALSSTFVQRWGGIPDLLTRDTDTSYGVWAHPTHWRGVIYEELIHDRTPEQPFTLTGVGAVLAKHGIRQHYDRKTAFKGLITFLERVEQVGLLSIHRDDHGRVVRLVPSGYNIEDIQRLERERAEAKRRAAEEWRVRDRAERERLAREREAERLRLDAEREAQEALRRQHAAQWEESDLRSAVIALFGDVPPAIAWPGGTDRDAIAVDRACWHAHIYLSLIHGRPSGHQFTAADAIAVLRAHDIAFPLGEQAAQRAITSYLFNLGQRGILQRLPDEHAASPDATQTVMQPIRTLTRDATIPAGSAY